MSDDTPKTETASPPLFELYITFGQKYAPEGSTDWLYSEENRHPLGMHRDGYAVIEAPNYAIARGIANAVFGQQFAFDYPADNWDAEQNAQMGWYTAGELLRIEWVNTDRLQARKQLMETAERVGRESGVIR
jgi:hypothetical protein